MTKIPRRKAIAGKPSTTQGPTQPRMRALAQEERNSDEGEEYRLKVISKGGRPKDKEAANSITQGVVLEKELAGLKSQDDGKGHYCSLKNSFYEIKRDRDTILPGFWSDEDEAQVQAQWDRDRWCGTWSGLSRSVSCNIRPFSISMKLAAETSLGLYGSKARNVHQNMWI